MNTAPQKDKETRAKPHWEPPAWFAKAFADARLCDKLGITMEELSRLEARKPWSRKDWKLALKVNFRVLMIMGDGSRALKAKQRSDRIAAQKKTPCSLLQLNPKLLRKA